MRECQTRSIIETSAVIERRAKSRQSIKEICLSAATPFNTARSDRLNRATYKSAQEIYRYIDIYDIDPDKLVSPHIIYAHPPAQEKFARNYASCVYIYGITDIYIYTLLCVLRENLSRNAHTHTERSIRYRSTRLQRRRNRIKIRHGRAGSLRARPRTRLSRLLI